MMMSKTCESSLFLIIIINVFIVVKNIQPQGETQIVDCSHSHVLPPNFGYKTVTTKKLVIDTYYT